MKRSAVCCRAPVGPASEESPPVTLLRAGSVDYQPEEERELPESGSSTEEVEEEANPESDEDLGVVSFHIPFRFCHRFPTYGSPRCAGH